MIERRCNFCGDVLDHKHEHPSMRIPCPAGGELAVRISCEHHPDKQYNDNPETQPSGMFGMFIFCSPNESKRDPFDTCFGCAAHLVAVAYDQYVKKGASA